MANARLEELKARFDENPRRYFAPYANELRKTGDFAQAVSICRSHLAVQPGHVSGHIVLAQALNESGAIEEARAEFEVALELDPENLIALRAMGDMARAGGDAAVAREWYQRVLDADPRNEEIARTLRDMAAPPNELAPPPPSAPAPLSMLMPEPPPDDATAGNGRAEPAAGANPEPAATDHDVTPTHVPAVAERQPDQLSEPQPAPAPEAPAPEPIDAFDDFVPFESLDSVEPSSGSEVPPRLAAEPVDLSEFTVTLDEAAPLSDEPPAASHAARDTHDPIWSGSDELALGEDGFEAFAADAHTPEASHGHVAPPANDDAWMTQVSPTADLSDYEAAPELFLDETQPSLAPAPESVHVESSPAETSAPPEATFQDDIESWFDTHETPAAPAPPTAQAVAGPEHLAELVPEPTVEAPSPGVEFHAFAEATTQEVAVPAASASEMTSDAVADEPSNDPEPVAAASTADPLMGQTPTMVDAVPEQPAAPFVTETLAELYLQQGFRDEALAIYRQLIERSPSDLSLRRRAEAIERGALSDVVPDIAARTATTGHRASVSVRTFFSRIARRVPSRPASGSGPGRGSRTTGSWEAIGRQSDGSAGEPGQGFGDGPMVETAGGAGDAGFPSAQSSTLASLFAAARPTEEDTRAATALASAFSESPTSHSPSGRPSRTAERELSLDHLFRDDGAPSRDAGAPTSPSLDEFYRSPSPSSPSTGDVAGNDRAAHPGTPGTHPPEERNTDLRQFTAWLEGLKKK